MNVTAIYPGTFDPLTNGHTDLIHRAAKMFDHVIVAIAHNPSKQPCFTLDERVELANKILAHLDNVSVIGFSGLLADLAREHKAEVLIRGIRAVSDFDYEAQMALTNRDLCHQLDTVFFMTSRQYVYLSSSIVREMILYKADVSHLVPQSVVNLIKRRHE